MRQCAPLAVLLLLATAGTVTAQASIPGDSTAARLALGRKLFEGKGLCFSCHGKAGEGALGASTRLAGRPLVHVKPKLDEIVALIKVGVDSAHSSIGQPMPAKGGSRLTDSEIEAVAGYVLELQKQSIMKKP